MTLSSLAAERPDAPVILHFRNGSGLTGLLITTAALAAAPNRSMRYFPPEGTTAASLGWPVPYWYADECVSIELAHHPNAVAEWTSRNRATAEAGAA